jgi:hypothetical protein
MRATIANITDEDITRCFQNNLFSKHTYHDLMARWADKEDEENDHFPKCNNEKQGNNNNHFNKGQRNNSRNPQKRKSDQ